LNGNVVCLCYCWWKWQRPYRRYECWFFYTWNFKRLFGWEMHLKANLSESTHVFFQSLSPFGITILGWNVEAHLSWWHKHAKLLFLMGMHPGRSTWS
jgi:hypothetical protein